MEVLVSTPQVMTALERGADSQTRLFWTGRARAGSSFKEQLPVHTLARLLLNGHIKNIQVSWVKLGSDTALGCLEADANDFSGTLMEESISNAAGSIFGESISQGEIRALIRTTGRTPVEHTTPYEIRRVFEQPDASDFLPLERMAVQRENSVVRDQVMY